jgi:galactarate dehydratase
MTTPARTPGRPLRIEVHDDDNVAIVVNSTGLAAGTRFDDGLVLTEHVPQGHKVALEDIPEGGVVRRYGEVIGHASRPLPRGCLVDEAAVRLPPPPDLDSLPLSTRAPGPPAPLEGYTFDGYRNPDGSVGTRNVLGISTSVNCVAGTVDHVVRLARERLLPRFPKVDNVVGLNHQYGCGVAIDAPDAAIPIRALRNLALNPNFGGQVLIVSLGCEKLQPERLLPDAPAVGDPGDVIVRLQDERFTGFEAMVDAILAMAERRLAALDRRTRQACPVSDLVVGVQCGGSDAFSGVTANPAVGFCSDLLVRAGATVMFSEVTEVRDAVHLLTPRCATPDIGRALVREMEWYDRYLASGGIDRSANPTPGNKAGGLSNIVEKALGSAAKSGTSAITDVLAPGERATRKGLVFAATPASDFVCGTMQLAAGMTLQVFTTGRGTPYGLAAAPVIKMSSRSDLSARWHDLVDIDAGRIATGEKTIEEVGWELFQLVLDVASGRTIPHSDRWGLDNGLTIFNPAPIT